MRGQYPRACYIPTSKPPGVLLCDPRLSAKLRTAGLDRVRKKHIYAREGVEYVWLVDPVGRTLESFQLQEGRWVELGSWSGSDLVRAEPFDAIELELQALWLPELHSPDR